LQVTAEVTDASRRTIQAESSLSLPVAAFDAFLHAQRGFYGPDEPVQVDVRTADAQEHGVRASGEVRVLRRVYRDDKASWEEAHREPFQTSADGTGVF